MKRYFRILTIFLCLSVCVSALAACNTAPEPSETSGDSGTSEEVTTGAGTTEAGTTGVFEFPFVSRIDQADYEVLVYQKRNETSQIIDVPKDDLVSSLVPGFGGPLPGTGSSAPKTVTVQWGGYSYVLKYDTSRTMAGTHTRVHTYDSDEGVTVWIDAETEEIVKYDGFSYPNDLAAREDYLAYLQDVLPEYDLSMYQSDCTMTYEVGGSTKTFPGFRPCGENERLVSYDFQFEKRIQGVKTSDYLRVQFRGEPKTLTIELCDRIEEANYSYYFENKEMCDAVALAYLEKQLKTGIQVLDVAISRRLIVYDEEAYVEYTLQADCAFAENPKAMDGEYSAVLYLRKK